jgi:hypothetical protein
MANERAFGVVRILDKQIQVATATKIPEQIFLIAKDNTRGQLANAARERTFGNRGTQRRHCSTICLHSHPTMRARAVHYSP